eukprot:TRINITY_DN46825_c0_g1_i1.p1 TRINITY_DN46825_c0_g1~~TRINITY_DN46825_c0_g1_i1.p1  ORF type:complete len:246 (-),score=49.40 TRINITY_DN46825_c0_g1_i1:316-1005(-)
MFEGCCCTDKDGANADLPPPADVDAWAEEQAVPAPIIPMMRAAAAHAAVKSESIFCEEYSVQLCIQSQAETGLQVDSSDDKVIVSKVIGGAAEAWNASCDSKLDIRPGDQIVAVEGNNIAPDTYADTMAALPAKHSVSVAFRRPHIKSLKVTKNGRKLGVATSARAGFGVVIKEITDGVISEWGKKHPQHAVKPQDRIVEVNGKTGDVYALTKLLGSSDDLEITAMSWI